MKVGRWTPVILTAGCSRLLWFGDNVTEGVCSGFHGVWQITPPLWSIHTLHNLHAVYVHLFCL